MPLQAAHGSFRAAARPRWTVPAGPPIDLPNVGPTLEFQHWAKRLIPYWLLFAFFATGAVTERPNDEHRQRVYPMLVVGALMIALMIGFRYQVGGDWEPYERMFSLAGYADLGRVLAMGDPGYQFLNWLVQRLGGAIWLVNLIGGLIFCWGLLSFARAQRYPWLAVVVAIPYLVIVVGLGYSRQAIAIGVLMVGLSSHLRSGSTLKFAAYVAVAALFHKTAVVVFPLVALTTQRSRLLNLLVTVAAAVLLYDIFLSESVDLLVRNYIEQGYSSQGAAVRVAMSVVPAVLFLISSRRFGFSEGERLIWRNFSLAALFLTALLLLLPSSTVVDRIALYIIPLQLAVLSRIPDAYLKRHFALFLVILYSLAVQYTWLNFAAHAKYWIPYKVHEISR